MTSQFDPYYYFLGIPAKDQPPDHYRLLGLERFESDLDVIERAADRQMLFLQRHESGDRAEEVARLLGEVSRARLCLLNANKKAAYDKTLQSRLAREEQDQGAGNEPVLLQRVEEDESKVARAPLNQLDWPEVEGQLPPAIKTARPAAASQPATGTGAHFEALASLWETLVFDRPVFAWAVAGSGAGILALLVVLWLVFGRSRPADIAGTLPEPAPVQRSAKPTLSPPSGFKSLTNSVGMKFVLIPAGEFLMGSPDSDREAQGDEKPQHPVRITEPFYPGRDRGDAGPVPARDGDEPELLQRRQRQGAGRAGLVAGRPGVLPEAIEHAGGASGGAAVPVAH